MLWNQYISLNTWVIRVVSAFSRGSWEGADMSSQAGRETSKGPLSFPPVRDRIVQAANIVLKGRRTRT
jgi:hypothetical protein